MLKESVIKNKWKEIKGGVRNLWGNISEEEIESSRGNLKQLTVIIQKRSNESFASVQEKMTRLMNSFDNDTDKGISENVSSFDRAPKKQS